MMSHIEMEYAKTLRDLAEAQAEIVRLKGEAESWEKVFDRTCEHLADAKEQLRLCNVDQFTTAAELADAVTKERKPVPEFELIEKWEGE